MVTFLLATYSVERGVEIHTFHGERDRAAFLEIALRECPDLKYAVSVVGLPLECLRCGYKWVAKFERPRVCPVCKSGVWFKPRVKRPESPVAHGDSRSHYIS